MIRVDVTKQPPAEYYRRTVLTLPPDVLKALKGKKDAPVAEDEWGDGQ